MDAVNFTNIVMYVVIGVLSIKLWRKGEVVPAIALGTLALHGFLFNGFYLYRDIVWEACPPVCGLQNWSTALRLHALLAIATSMVYRLWAVK